MILLILIFLIFPHGNISDKDNRFYIIFLFYILTNLMYIKLYKLFPFQTLKRLNFSVVFVELFYCWLFCQAEYAVFIAMTLII